VKEKLNFMAWKTPEDKSRFFEDLERAFNTPPTRSIVVPQVSDIEVPTTEGTPVKRRKVDNGPREVKRKPSISSENKTSLAKTTNPTHAGPERSRSLRQNTSKPKPAEKSSRRRSTSERVDEQKKSSLLDGMVLYFIPNSRKNGLRKFRMTLFAQHGADVRYEWSEEITHIICDQNIMGERVLRDLRWEQFPVSSLFGPLLMLDWSHYSE
jgi:hypothetical protein